MTLDKSTEFIEYAQTIIKLLKLIKRLRFYFTTSIFYKKYCVMNSIRYSLQDHDRLWVLRRQRVPEGIMKVMNIDQIPGLTLSSRLGLFIGFHIVLLKRISSRWYQLTAHVPNEVTKGYIPSVLVVHAFLSILCQLKLFTLKFS